MSKGKPFSDFNLYQLHLPKVTSNHLRPPNPLIWITP